MPESTCSIKNCEAVVLARGWCSKHYDRWRKHGDPEKLIRVFYPGDEYPARHRKVVNAWHKANPEKVKAIVLKGRENGYKRMKILRKEKYAKICSIKLKTGCMDCGYNLSAVALDFDHRVGEVKLFTLSMYNSKSWDNILREIAKCDVVCANCHRIRTNQRGQHRKNRVNTVSQYEQINSETIQTKVRK